MTVLQVPRHFHPWEKWAASAVAHVRPRQSHRFGFRGRLDIIEFASPPLPQ
jgi:hypothetical protein